MSINENKGKRKIVLENPYNAEQTTNIAMTLNQVGITSASVAITGDGVSELVCNPLQMDSAKKFLVGAGYRVVEDASASDMGVVPNASSLPPVNDDDNECADDDKKKEIISEGHVELSPREEDTVKVFMHIVSDPFKRKDLIAFMAENSYYASVEQLSILIEQIGHLSPINKK